jgi:hypothetical protein
MGVFRHALTTIVSADQGEEFLSSKPVVAIEDRLQQIDLADLWSQPPADVTKFTLDFTKQFAVFATFANTSGGSTLSR